MTELLCLKSTRGDYIRSTGNTWELTSMSKATVFTMQNKLQMMELFDRLRSNGMDVYCVKLTITEERFEI